jgi:hypothetical protein
MKASDLIMRIIENCGGNLNKEIERFLYEETVTEWGVPKSISEITFKINVWENDWSKRIS